MTANNQIAVSNMDTNPTITVNDTSYFAVSFMKEEFIDEKELGQFISGIERLVRGSPEYKKLVKYIKTEFDLSHCTYLNALNVENVTIELHHTPYTLYNIVSIIIQKHLKNQTPFNTFSVALDVIKLHYCNLVGLVSLSKTIHELMHSDNRVFIHRDLIIGNVDQFYALYEEYMDEEQKRIYLNWSRYSDENPADSLNSLDLYDVEKRKNQIHTTSTINEIYTAPVIENNVNKNTLNNNSNIIDTPNDDIGF